MEAILLYTDQELLAALQRGDSNAFENIYKRYWTRLYPVVYQRLYDKEQTEDVSIQNLKSYLFTAARYQAITYLTRRRGPLSFFEPFESMLLEAETPDE